MKHIKLLTILCLILALVCCFMACDEDGTEDDGNGDGDGTGTQECTHEYTDVVTAPKCLEGGYTTHTCSKCGDVKKDTEVAATGHTYVDSVTSPTCTADGYTTHTCSACNDSYKDTPVALLGHNWNYTTATSTSCKCQRCQTTYYWSSVTLEYDEITEGSDVIGYKILSFSGTLPETLKIPAVYNGKPVLAIGENAFDEDYGEVRNLHSLIVPDTVIDLGGSSFSDCDYLEDVSLPNTLQHIGYNPFQSTKYEEKMANKDMGQFTLPKDFIINGIYMIRPYLELYTTEYAIPEGITLIADNAFSNTNCASLQTLTLPKSLRYLGATVFGSTTQIVTINIHKGVIAFNGNPFGPINYLKLRNINFEGTQAEWNQIKNYNLFGRTQYMKYNQKIS